MTFSCALPCALIAHMHVVLSRWLHHAEAKGATPAPTPAPTAAATPAAAPAAVTTPAPTAGVCDDPWIKGAIQANNELRAATGAGRLTCDEVASVSATGWSQQQCECATSPAPWLPVSTSQRVSRCIGHRARASAAWLAPTCMPLESVHAAPATPSVTCAAAPPMFGKLFLNTPFLNNVPKTPMYSSRNDQVVGRQHVPGAKHGATVPASVRLNRGPACRDRGLSHDGFSQRCQDIGFRSACAENVLYNYATSSDAPDISMTQWFNSDGHRKNLMNPSYTKVGYGFVRCYDGRVYWTGLYGK